MQCLQTRHTHLDRCARQRARDEVRDMQRASGAEPDPDDVDLADDPTASRP